MQTSSPWQPLAGILSSAPCTPCTIKLKLAENAVHFISVEACTASLHWACAICPISSSANVLWARLSVCSSVAAWAYQHKTNNISVCSSQAAEESDLILNRPCHAHAL